MTNPEPHTPIVTNDPRPADPDDDKLLTPGEVATMFRVSPKTVTRWHQTGKISAIRTPGGHRRFRAKEIKQLLGDA
ncbi:MAG: MerR family transcriptional regulator [Actinobacteria bacterium]|jgi:excisionase family DNA binding protein|uniref:Unannotated protein n=1 Tax=freshwater metagenome TaxID=449393 RepID=A0A6J7RLM9_9ZZZZ|nr:helix-turn-helix domain-containing protein [Acidimicrobiia bacterium]MSV41233.1 BldC family transcriptional regulator [Actinomycetota bacterium]GDX30258.1 hypothetical protein LBMAG14_07340 [Actinomycetes bacterium]MSO17651.1 BldC family transcriptional regulator [Acidimicrobiia bacterium]MSV95081.1 BldC family transcriptional regulator [Actinomycetota bacterium]